MRPLSTRLRGGQVSSGCRTASLGGDTELIGAVIHCHRGVSLSPVLPAACVGPSSVLQATGVHPELKRTLGLAVLALLARPPPPDSP